MIKKTIQTIHDLRIFFLAMILAAFLGVVGINPVSVWNFIGSSASLAGEPGVSSQATVKPNPYNTLALQLREKESSLDSRESDLDQKEQSLLAINAKQNKIIYGVIAGIIVLFLLIVANYILDFQRRKRDAARQN